MRTPRTEESRRKYGWTNKSERYLLDPVYRERIRSAAKARYSRQRQGLDKKLTYSVKKRNGVLLYTISVASGITGRSIDFLRNWEAEGIIPKTLYTDSRGWRLYTAHQLHILKFTFMQYKSKKWKKHNAKRFLGHNWKGSYDKSKGDGDGD
jgi:hypothetical protein